MANTTARILTWPEGHSCTEPAAGGQLCHGPCHAGGSVAWLRGSLEPLTLFSGTVPAQSCSNTLVIQAQHERRDWTSNFAACQEGLCQKIHRQQHICTTFRFTDTFPNQIYLFRMKFSSFEAVSGSADRRCL